MIRNAPWDSPPSIRDGVRGVRAAYRRFGYLRARFPQPIGTRPSTYLSVCAIFRDEARYLAEWVTFHRLQGVERFYLYNNLSLDDWRSELAPEMASGVVEAIDWPDVPGQMTAYEDCIKRHRRDTRWIAFIDLDEFLFSPTGQSLPDVLGRFERHPGVVVNWRVHGTNGRKFPPERLVIESYPRRAPDNSPANVLVKSVVYPRNALGCSETVHTFRLRGNPVGEDGHAACKQTREPPTADLLRINHYYAKSEAEFQRKTNRPNARDGVVIERFGDPPSTVYDDSVEQFVDDVKAALAARSRPTATGGRGLSR